MSFETGRRQETIFLQMQWGTNTYNTYALIGVINLELRKMEHPHLASFFAVALYT